MLSRSWQAAWLSNRAFRKDVPGIWLINSIIHTFYSQNAPSIGYLLELFFYKTASQAVLFRQAIQKIAVNCLTSLIPGSPPGISSSFQTDLCDFRVPFVKIIGNGELSLCHTDPLFELRDRVFKNQLIVRLTVNLQSPFFLIYQLHP